MFDLELPEDFTPVNADGEMGSFQLLSMSEVSVLGHIFLYLTVI